MAKYIETEYATWAAENPGFDWNLTPELVRLPIDTLSDEIVFVAQRDLDTERSTGMSKCFIPAVAWPITVVELMDGDQAGQTIPADGQHRWWAALMAGETTFLAIRYRMTQEQASAFFRLRNGKAVVKTTHMDSTIAAEYSLFPPVLDMEAVLQRHGCYLDRASRSNDGAIVASQAVDLVYRVDDGALLSRTLDVITDCWGRRRQPLSEHVIQAVALLLAHFGDRIDAKHEREMRKQFREKSLETILLETDELEKRLGRRTRSKAFAIEAVLIDTYNFNRTGGQRLTFTTLASLYRMGTLQKLALQRRSASDPQVEPAQPATPAR